MTGLGFLVAAAAFVAGVEIARRHPDNPWRYMANGIKDTLRKDSNIQEGEVVGEVVDETIDTSTNGKL